MSCVVPGCSSGYGTANKFPDGVGKHRFPKNNPLRDVWIKSIPRSDWTPSAYSIVCSLHFDKSDYEERRQDSNKHRHRGELKTRRLKKTAYPRIFPTCPSYYSRPKPHERSHKASTAFRQQQAINQAEKDANDFLTLDTVKSFEDLSNYEEKFPSTWNIITLKKTQHMIFEEMMFDDDGKPVFKFSLVILEDLSFRMFAKDSAVAHSRVQHITKDKKVHRFSDIANILAYLNSHCDEKISKTDVIKNCIEKLEIFADDCELSNTVVFAKLRFIIEQSRLSTLPSHSQRYSTNFIWLAIQWMKTSPVLYRLLVKEGQLTLPSVSYLQRLTSSYCLQTGLSSSTLAYLSERIKSLTEEEKVVALQIDEVYATQRADFSGGTIFGMESGEPTRTLLTFFVSSLGGRYDDLVCFIPVVTLDAQFLLHHFREVLKSLYSVGFCVALSITDGHRTNVKFYTELCQGLLKVSIAHPLKDGDRLFLLFDPVHLMKNFYNNFQRKGYFLFPSFSEASKYQEANFKHLITVYQLELNMPVKLAYKLSHKVLCPGPIERQSVQLTCAIFHDSTIEALMYYSLRGYPEFSGTAEFLSIILGWFKIINSKSPFSKSPHRDLQQDAITAENITQKMSYLRGFVDCLCEWEAKHPECGLSKETFHASKQSSETIAALSEYLLTEKKFQYVLPIKFQNDKLEGRFGKMRQMCGGNLFTSVRQFLESERTLRMLKLAELDLNMADIKQIFAEAENELSSRITDKAEAIVSSVMSESEDVELVPNIPSSDKDALLYVAGCFCRKIALASGCTDCSDLLLETSQSGLKESSVSSLSYLHQVDRGGLTIPSELSFLSCAQAWDLYSKIMNNPSLQKQLHASDVIARKVFVEAFVQFIESSENTRLFFAEQKCDSGHKFALLARVFAFKCFNIFSKNYVSQLNSQIHAQKSRLIDKKQKRNPLEFKIQKLQSTQLM